MIFIISYDISKNANRNKVAKYLIKKGFARLQYSVFAGQAEWRTITTIKTELTILLQHQNPYAANDKLMVLRINKNSFDTMWTQGAFFEPKLFTGTKKDLIFL